MGKFIDNIVGPIVIFLFFSVAVAGFVCMVIDVYHWDHYREISTVEYQKVEEWGKEFPQLRAMSKEALWEDGIINKDEYKAIQKMKTQIKNEQLKQKINGEDEEK